MPRRARGQLVLFEQYAIAPTHFGKVVKRRDANNASTNYDNAGSAWNISHDGILFDLDQPFNSGRTNNLIFRSFTSDFDAF